MGTATSTHVCQNCPGASDTNTGTQSCPFVTINRGISAAMALSAPRVIIASSYNGTVVTYSEDITVPSGVMLEGKWAVTAPFSWARGGGAGARTQVQNVNASGLKFVTGAPRTTGIDGLFVNIAAGGSTGMQLGIDVGNSSPTLRDFRVAGGLASPATEIGVRITGTATSRPTPLLEGVPTSGPGLISPIGGATAVGLHIERAAAEVSSVQVTQTTGGTTMAIHLVDAAGSTLRNVTAIAQSGNYCWGIFSEGDATGVVIENSSVLGCGNTSTVSSYGVMFDRCPLGGAGPAPILRTSSITGGAASFTNSPIVAGVVASDGCALEISSNLSIQGATSPTSAMRTRAYGVLCTREGFSNLQGADAPCRVLSNGPILAASSSSVFASYGVACIGTCAASNAACTGSCAQIHNNRPGPNGGQGITTGPNATTRYNLYVEHSNPSVTRNTFGTSTGAVSCTRAAGAELIGSGAYLANNLIVGPVCPGGASYGVELVAAMRALDSSIPSANLHSNTILAYPGGGGAPPTQAAVRLVSLPTALVRFQMGRFVNNIFQAGPGGATHVFEESDSFVDPFALIANDFFMEGPIIGFPPLYRDEGSSTLGTAMQINSLTDTMTSANVSLIPNFQSFGLPRLQSSSMLKGIGSAAPPGAPADDWEGQVRPQPADAGSPDIGADELP